MQIVNSTLADIDTIFECYDDAIAFQKTVFEKHWLVFERSLVEQEIKEKRQYKILIDGEVAGIFVLSFNDDMIWKEKALIPAVYIHRIVTRSSFRGYGLLKHIIEWSKHYCREHELKYIRLDTWGDNPKLLNYYMKWGFQHIESIPIRPVGDLPIHYNGLLALLEMKVD